MTMQRAHAFDGALALASGALATFVAVYHAGTISDAAAQLHLSQPATSRRLSGLERQLGTALFDRIPGGLRPTAAGQVLLPHAERALAAEVDAVLAVGAVRDRTVGEVSVGVVGSLVEPYLTATLRAAIELYPEIEIQVTTATSARISDLVRRGELSLGVSYAQPHDPDLEVSVLAHERLEVVCSPDDPLADGRLRANQLRYHRWLVFPDPPTQPETSGTIARRTLERHHVPADLIRPIDSLTAQRSLAIAGYGFALLPAGMVADDLATGRLATIAVPALDAEAPVALVTRRASHQSRATAAVIALLIDGTR